MTNQSLIVNRIPASDKPTHSINRPIKSSDNFPSLRGKDAVKRSHKDLLYGYDNMSRTINDFMYTGRPGRSPKKVHTVAEHEEFLRKVLERCWDNYNNGVKELGGF